MFTLCLPTCAGLSKLPCQEELVGQSVSLTLCKFATLPVWHSVSWALCQLATLSVWHSANLLLCQFITLQDCHSARLPLFKIDALLVATLFVLCQFTTLPVYHSVGLQLCQFINLLAYHTASLLFCQLTNLRACWPLGHFSSLPVCQEAKSGWREERRVWDVGGLWEPPTGIQG